MISKSQLKFIASLGQKKFRQEHRLFMAEGEKVVTELLTLGFKAEFVCTLADYQAQEIQAHVAPEVFFTVSKSEMERMSQLSSYSPVLAVFHQVNQHSGAPIDFTSGLTLYLDGIKDPGNLGTIIRTCDWFGVQQVVLSPECVEVYNPKVVQATMGSLGRVRWHIQDAQLFFNQIPAETPVYGAVLGGQSMYAIKLQLPAVLVIGSESHGISEAILKQIKQPITIPNRGAHLAGTRIDSLNAAIATSILCAAFMSE